MTPTNLYHGPLTTSGVKRTISTDDAPAAVGAYSQATTNGELLITAGQLPLTVDGELLDDRPVAEQTRQCLSNVEAILAAEGLSLTDVLKTTVYLDDIDDFEAFNEAYSEFFESEPPARSAIEVAAVPKGAAVEIEAIAVVE
ncbi:reactive intermediate/imine deaminase [Halorubrum vacuolatum]|uniref:Reactive intermediate/imine deaminase n=1 Tax=Halorubrum vacuolatum TaxID=63740 RepID=A0A238X0F1_HALVU|nr:reactive intermediate/imine deaminase [Halorubrum vacuolatum]